MAINLQRDETLELRLLKAAEKWKNEIVRNARQNLGDKAKLISVSAKVTIGSGRGGSGSGRIVITVTAGDKAKSEYGDVKRVARAYEYGSGIHGKERKKYRIAPRRKKVLAFYWDAFDNFEEEQQYMVFNSPKFAGFADDGRILFRFVDHPGVQAVNGGKGYMKPAIDKVRKQIRREIPAEIRKEVIGSFMRAFKK